MLSARSFHTSPSIWSDCCRTPAAGNMYYLARLLEGFYRKNGEKEKLPNPIVASRIVMVNKEGSKALANLLSSELADR